MTEKNIHPPEEVVTYLLSKPYHEISQGFLISKASELASVYFELLLKGVARMPIIGTKDGKVFILASTKVNQHSTLLSNLAAAGYTKDDVLFTTSLETLTNDPPQKPYLRLHVSPHKMFYIKLGKESDTFPMFPLGKTDLTALFSSEDIVVVQ